MTTQKRSRVRLLPYKAGSMSARALARGAGILRLKGTGTGQKYNGRTRFRPRPTDVIVNWGGHQYPAAEFTVSSTAPRFINSPRAVYFARDKRLSFDKFREAGVPTLEFTVDIAEAQRWLDEKHVVVQRNTATGQGGAGIVVLDPTLTVNVRATGDGVLWTKYFKRKQEFRIHVWGKDILDIQEKRKRRETDVDTRIRSHDNGWVFCRDGVTCPESVSQAAVAAVQALGLDFGAVDIGWNDKFKIPAVFEVNTAPGLEGATLEKYVSKIKELL